MENNYQYDVCVIGGFGHVGLPLGVSFADAGLKVLLFDVADDVRSIIESGKMPFFEEGGDSLLQKVFGKTLFIAGNLDEVRNAKSVLITIGTPLDEYLNPNLNPIFNLGKQLVEHLRPGHHLILRSTVFPGTSRALNEFFSNQGLDVNLSYCPERIIQGKAIKEIRELTQIISGFTDFAIDQSEQLFSRLGVDTIHVTVSEAELTKLFANAWRYVQFAIANQFYMMAKENGADFEKIYHAMTYNYARSGDFPRPGFTAGPCLMKDTLQLAACYGNKFDIGYSAMRINEGLPNFIVEQLLRDRGSDLRNVRVGILGMAFKADIDDIRDSLSYKLAKILRFHGAIVVCSDEYVKDPMFVSKEKIVESCPIVIVAVPHSSYKGFDVPDSVHVIDLWDVVNSSGQIKA